MPLAGLLGRFLWSWTLAFTLGMGAAAWYQLPALPVTYGLLLACAYLAMAAWLKKRQRCLTRAEQGPALLGLTVVALGVHLGLNALAASLIHYGASLDPPLPLDVRQGFIALQAPLYAMTIWIAMQQASAHYPSRSQRPRATVRRRSTHG